MAQDSMSGVGDSLQVLQNTNIIQDNSAFKDPKNVDKFQFLKEAYEGTGGFYDGRYLWPFARESWYNDSRRCSIYKNIFKSVVNAKVDPVFSDLVDRETGSDLFRSFIMNADNCGTHIQSIVEAAVLYARLYDVCFLVMDNVPAEDQPKTLSDALEARIMPYIYIKEPQDVYAYETSRWGQLSEITFTDDSIMVGNIKCQTYRHWTTTGWDTFYIDPKDRKAERKIPIASGDHDLGLLPIISILDFAKTKNMRTMPYPSCYDMGLACLGLFNKESELSNLEKYQGFGIFYVSGVEADTVTIGHSNFISVNNEAKFAPGFASPNPAHHANLLKSCERMAEDIISLAGQQGVVIGIQQAKSGIAKEWDFRAQEAVLRKTSQAAEALEMDIANLFKLYTKTSFDYTADYPDRFAPKKDEDTVTQDLAIINGIIPPPKPLLDRLWKEIAVLVIGSDTDTGDTLIAELDEIAAEEIPVKPPEITKATPDVVMKVVASEDVAGDMSQEKEAPEIETL
jgi:hypothetical protein